MDEGFRPGAEGVEQEIRGGYQDCQGSGMSVKVRSSDSQRWVIASSTRWMSQAACRNYPYFWWEASVGPEARMAKAICWQQCPVRQQCYEAIMAYERDGDRGWWRTGIWGGVGAHQRGLIAQGEMPEPSNG